MSERRFVSADIVEVLSRFVEGGIGSVVRSDSLGHEDGRCIHHVPYSWLSGLAQWVDGVHVQWEDAPGWVGVAADPFLPWCCTVCAADGHPTVPR